MTIDPQLTSQLMLAFAGALFGALLGGLMRWSSGRSDRRLQLTLALYNEFHSPAYNHIRILAHEGLERGGPLPIAYQEAVGETKEAIATIVHFWEKVAILLREGAIDLRLTRRFLGQYGRWWSQLLCDRDPRALDDPEWGQTLKDLNWAFKRLVPNGRGNARR